MYFIEVRNDSNFEKKFYVHRNLSKYQQQLLLGGQQVDFLLCFFHISYGAHILIFIIFLKVILQCHSHSGLMTLLFQSCVLMVQLCLSPGFVCHGGPRL
jgi:hypothetical protein